MSSKQYMVRFYLSSSGSEKQTAFKVFADQMEAWEYSHKLGDRFIEQKLVEMPAGYPPTELDMS